jgi:hypothetical protein
MTRSGVTLAFEEDRPMIRRSLRLFGLVAAIGSAASLALDVCGHQAMAASTVSLNSTAGVYSLSYLTNTTITAATDGTVVALANTLGASAGTTTTGITTATISSATASTYGWLPASTGAAWIGPNSIGTSFGVVGAGGTTPNLDASSNFVSGFNSNGGALGGSAPQGLYYYSTTFALTPGVYGIAGGLWQSDNQGAAIFLNGINLGMTNPFQFKTPAPSAFNAPSADFNTAGAGLNTLTFVVWNENYTPIHGSPNGLEVQGTVTAVPEPTAIAVVVSGLPIMGLYWAARRRRRFASV